MDKKHTFSKFYYGPLNILIPLRPPVEVIDNIRRILFFFKVPLDKWITCKHTLLKIRALQQPSKINEQMQDFKQC